MSFDKALQRLNKRVYPKTGIPVCLFNDEYEIDTHGVFDNPELLQKLNGIKGRQSNITFKTTEKLLCIPTPSVDVREWLCTIDEVNYFIEKTLSDGSGETLCILSNLIPEKTKHLVDDQYGI